MPYLFGLCLVYTNKRASWLQTYVIEGEKSQGRHNGKVSRRCGQLVRWLLNEGIWGFIFRFRTILSRVALFLQNSSRSTLALLCVPGWPCLDEAVTFFQALRLGIPWCLFMHGCFKQ